MRHAPEYAFSKITMDDLAIPFKMEDGKRAWAYQIWDVASGCVIGKAFARSNDEGSGKNRDLFKAAMMDMFRLIVKEGWGMPAEIEVEQHISNTFKGGLNDAGEFVADLLSEGYLFPFVRFCNPSNPQEKRAEHNIKGKKYQFQNKRVGFQRRPFTKLEANRLNEDKNKIRYSFESVVANELEDISSWNNQPHSDQTKYPGLTRWQVLEQCQNPDLNRPHLPTLARYVGKAVTTSLVRSFVTVQHAKYIVPINIINSGRLNSTTLTAHYLHDKDGQIPEIYLYQNNEFVCKALKTKAFNESRFEKTPEDDKIMHSQMGHISSFDKMVKERTAALKKLSVLPAFDSSALDSFRLSLGEGRGEVEAEMACQAEPVEAHNAEPDYWTKKALEDL